MSEQQVARTAGAAALRGALLVGAAVLIGVLLLSKNDGILASAEGDDDSTEISASNSDDGDGDATSTSTSESPQVETSVPEPTTTTTTAAPVNLRDKGNVQIHVSNGAWVDDVRVGGAAGRTRDELLALGYNMRGVSNWDNGRQEKTTVYFVPGGGFQNDAREVARQIGVAQTQVVPSPGPAITERLADVDVLVILGADTEA